VSVFAQLALNGAVAGSVYALIALGFALIFTSSRVFHFAHGGVYTFSALPATPRWSRSSSGIVAGFLAAIVSAALIGVLVNILLYEPMKAGGVSPFVAMISSFGVLIIITHVTAMIWGFESGRAVARWTDDGLSPRLGLYDRCAAPDHRVCRRARARGCLRFSATPVSASQFARWGMIPSSPKSSVCRPGG